MSPPVELQDYIGGLSDQRHLKETELRLGLPGSDSPERNKAAAVGLTLGLQTNNTNVPPGGPTTTTNNKRGFSDSADQDKKEAHAAAGGKAHDAASAAGKAQNSSAAAPPAAKTQAVGWPPIRNYRKNTMATNPSKNKEDGEVKQGHGFLYIKVSMDGAPYLRKVDLRTYSNYKDLSSALEKMFSCFTIGQCGSHENPGRDGLSEIRLMDLLNGSEYVLTYEDKDGDWMLVGDVPWQMFTDSCKRMRIMKSSDAIGLAPRAMEKSKNRH